jgi:hypothetical protein
MNQFPPSPRVYHLDRFKFFRKFSEIFESQGAPPVSTTPVANLPPVSATPVANFSSIFASVVDTGGKFATGVNDFGGKFKVNLKAKICIYVNSSTLRCPNKIIKIFLLEGFFHLPLVSLTPVANLELRICPRIFQKIRNGPNGIIRGLGETGLRKKPEAKNLVTLSL